MRCAFFYLWHTTVRILQINSSPSSLSYPHVRHPQTMIPTRYLPLPTTTSWTPVPARFTLWWRRKAVRGTCLVVATLLVVTLLKYWSCIVDYLGSDPDVGDDAAVQFDPSLDAAYVPFRPSKSHQPAASNAVMLKPSTELPSSCLDAHIAKGELCHNPKVPQLDVVWTWVNGSDLLFQHAVTRVENSLPEDDPYRPTESFLKARQYR